MVYLISNDKVKDQSSEIKNISAEEAIFHIKREKLICEDTETTTLNYRIKNPLLLIQIGTDKDQFVFDVYSGIDVDPLKSILSDRSVEKILVNGYFERNMLRSKGITLNSMFDLSLAAKVLRQGREPRYLDVDGDRAFIYSLRGMYKEYLDINVDKTQQQTFIHFDGKFTNEQILYAADDVKLFDLHEELVRKLIKNDLLCEGYELGKTVRELVTENKFYVTVLEMKAQEYFSDMLYNGIHLNKERWMALYGTNLTRLKDRERELNEHVVTQLANYKYHLTEPVAEVKEKQLDIFGNEVDIAPKKKKNNRRINWNSSPQVGKIYKEFYKELPKDKHGKNTLDIKVLQKLPHFRQDPFLVKYVNYKKTSKLVNSYGVNYLDNICPITGRVHFQIDQVLQTGRIAPSKPNLAQIPGDKEWRDCFTGQGNSKIVGADYSAQESQTMADKANDLVFIEFFKSGAGDSHSMVASKVFSVKEGREVIVSKNKLMVEHKGDLSNAFVDKYKADFPKAPKVYFEGNYLILEDDNPIKDDRVSCPLRQKGKILNFFISFGGSAYTLSADQNITMEEAKELIDSFFGAFKGLDLYFKTEKTLAIENGYSLTNTITRRKRFFPQWKEFRGYELEKEKIKKDLIKQFGPKAGTSIYYKGIKDRDSDLARINRRSYKMRGDIERAAMNNGIQGTAADMTKTSGILLQEKLEQSGFDLISEIRPVNYVHDEHALEVIPDDGLPEYAAEILKESMEEASSIFLNKLVIPAAPYINTCWQH